MKIRKLFSKENKKAQVVVENTKEFSVIVKEKNNEQKVENIDWKLAEDVINVLKGKGDVLLIHRAENEIQGDVITIPSWAKKSLIAQIEQSLLIREHLKHTA